MYTLHISYLHFSENPAGIIHAVMRSAVQVREGRETRPEQVTLTSHCTIVQASKQGAGFKKVLWYNSRLFVLYLTQRRGFSLRMARTKERVGGGGVRFLPRWGDRCCT